MAVLGMKNYFNFASLLKEETDIHKILPLKITDVSTKKNLKILKFSLCFEGGKYISLHISIKNTFIRFLL